MVDTSPRLSENRTMRTHSPRTHSIRNRSLHNLHLGLLIVTAIGTSLPDTAIAQQTKAAESAARKPNSDSRSETETEEDQATQQAVRAKFGKTVSDLEQQYEGKLAEAPEAIRMLIDISHGSQMLPGEGWFGPGASRYSYNWLLSRHDAKEGTPLSADDFRGLPHWLARIDRNHDGQITPDDLDWSDRNPWVQRAGMVNRFFRRMDPDADGLVSEGEWNGFFRRVAQGQDAISPDDLIDVLLAGTGGPAGFTPGDEPSKNVLLRGLIAGEIGSLQEGPKVGETAPDFTLKTHSGDQTIHLADLLGKKPIVLTFGNFTCGPFRSQYPGVEAVYRRFSHEATFLSIYVREAHPTDGWKMESNSRLGVEVAQPRTYGERVSVANQCHGLLKCSMPLLVDEIDDRVGNAYSGMPARLYVIDPQGKVVYKSGRGPFGFKPGEMEQALVMCLLEQHLAGNPPASGTDSQ